ncbi:hypothetical protein [Paenibacillus koleovorans]|uniref:hypothetical protein n=1 Tax=Paenibacillus koleovorans TaxID=121608 RepID=UPI000FD83FB4|nr:hypothetical protein [Paenibacillus koleovorans]
MKDFRAFAGWILTFTSRLEPSLLALGQAADASRSQYALPYENRMAYPVFYNKSIFDRTEIFYPIDGMNWEESSGEHARGALAPSGSADPANL